MGAVKKPFYAALRYIFHISLFVVPIWLTGHVVLWSESRFEWEWSSLPDELADWLIIFILGCSAYFFIRRIIVTNIRHNSSLSDYLLIIVTAMPFLSGYLFTHGSLDAIQFFENHMLTLHILSGEVMLITAAFLFYRTRLNPQSCTGCAACESNCPTGTLEAKDSGKIRSFSYSIYLCICCGSCLKACPEKAAELRHQISLKNFFKLFSRERIRSVELAECEGCGALFAPEPLLERVASTIVDEYGNYCLMCKKTKIAANFYKHIPLPKGIDRESEKNKTIVSDTFT
jgi:ferredoxin